jgi:hypothetical protein
MTPYTWSVRVRAEQAKAGTVYARNHAVRLGVALTFEPTDALPSALETAVGALGADLSTTFLAGARRRRLIVDSVEFALQFRLVNPLTHLGVIGEEGDPSIERIEGTFYVSADAEDADLQALWADTLARSPLYQTFRKATEIAFRFSPTL